MDIKTALDKLFSLHQFGVKLGLENIERLLEYLGNPEKELKIFHVAGSNGKGSTASFLASVLTESGAKTGLYTSPHFVDFNERIRIDGKQIPDEYILRFMEKLEDYIDEYRPTFFELTTAMAYQYFAENNIDYAVVEVGLGGRLDATNTILPLASVITTISYDHTHILGTSYEAIAREKAGIIKPDVPVFIGDLPDSAEKEIVSIAQERNSSVYRLNDVLKIEEGGITVLLSNGAFAINGTPLRGEHQNKNAALAAYTLDKIHRKIDAKTFRKGIDNIIKNTGIQGRYEIHNSNPKIIFDSAHNPEGISAFIKEFTRDAQGCNGKYLLFAAMKDKNNTESIKILSEIFDEIYFTGIDYHRAARPEELMEIAGRLNINSKIVTDKLSFINKFKERKDNSCLAVLGSIYLLGEIKNALKDKNVLTF